MTSSLRLALAATLLVASAHAQAPGQGDAARPGSSAQARAHLVGEVPAHGPGAAPGQEAAGEASAQGDEPDRIRVRDTVGLFAPAEVASMVSRLRTLAAETGFEVRLVTRDFRGFDGFGKIAEDLFEAEVSRLGHYRMALVLIGVDRNAGKGMVGTNLGAGLYQVMSREEAGDLFLAEGEPFSPARIRVGIDRLAARLEEWHTMTRMATEKLFPKKRRPWYHRFGVHFYPILALAALALGGLVALWRSRYCPSCGAEVKARVRFGGPGGVAVRTVKCFACGWIRKRRYEPGAGLTAWLPGGGAREERKR